MFKAKHDKVGEDCGQHLLSEAGGLLIEVLLGITILTLVLGAVIPVCLQHSRLRRVDDELYLAMIACRSSLEEMRAVGIGTLPSLDGVGFDVPGLNGNPKGLTVVPGDVDGLVGAFSVVTDKSSSGENLYEVVARVTWMGPLGRQNFQMSSLFAERTLN